MKIKSKAIFLAIIFLGFFGLAKSSLAAPVISSYSGDFSDGQILTIQGSDFGTSRTATYYQYFDDYNSDWNCNGRFPCSTYCSTFPSSGSVFTGDTDFVATCVGTGEDYTYMYHDLYPLLNLSKSYSNFSTGRGFWQGLGYYAGGIGGLPNSNVHPIFTNTYTEFFLTFYVYWDTEWTLNPAFEKIVGTWSGSNNNFGMIVDAGDQKIDYQVGQILGDNASINAPSGSSISRVGKWHEIKLYVKKQTVGNTDGIVKEWVDGNLIINDTTAKPIDDAYTFFNASGGMNITLGANVQCGGSGMFTCPGVDNEWVRAYDDFLMNVSDTDPCGGVFPCTALAYLSNSSTWGSGPTDKLNGDSNYARQKVGGTADADLGFKSFSDTQFKFEVNTTGLNASLPIYLYTTNWSGETNDSGFLLEESPDIIPPDRSNGFPTGKLSSGTKSKTISLTTNENATCKYSTSAGIDYSAMASDFTTTGGMSHSTNISGLSSNHSYSYYARCRDESLNPDTDDYTISFSVKKKSSSSSKSKPAKRKLSVNKKTIHRGEVLVQSGKKFTKNNYAFLYFQRSPGGSYYAPMRVRMSSSGAFSTSYRVPWYKPLGTYKWYAVDVGSGKKSKTGSYKIK